MHNVLECTSSSVEECLHISAKVDKCFLNPDIICTVLFNCTIRMKKWGERLNKVEQLAQSFRSNPLTTRYKPRLWPCQPSSVWKLFPRQSMAINFAQACKEVTSGFFRAALFQHSALLIFELVCVWEEKFWFQFHFFIRLPMFLHWKKKTHPRVKGSTWLLVIVSCGTTTGKLQSVFEATKKLLCSSKQDGMDLCRTFTHSLMHCYEVIPEGTVCKLYFDLEFHKPSNKEANGKTMVSRLIQVKRFPNFIVIILLEFHWAGYLY